MSLMHLVSLLRWTFIRVLLSSRKSLTQKSFTPLVLFPWKIVKYMLHLIVKILHPGIHTLIRMDISVPLRCLHCDIRDTGWSWLNETNNLFFITTQKIRLSTRYDVLMGLEADLPLFFWKLPWKFHNMACSWAHDISGS